MHRITVVLLFILCIYGCDFSANVANRSGILEDDYVEEPLSDMSKKYENALLVSNEILGFIGDRNADHIYAYYFDELFRERTSFDQFKHMMAQLNAGYGGLKNFKQMQWGFMTRNFDGKDVLISSKIAEFEGAMLKFY